MKKLVLFFATVCISASLAQAAQDYVIVIASVKVKAGEQENFKKAASAVVAPTLREQGAIIYEFSQSETDSTEFTTYERWQKAENLDAHLKSAHMVNFFGIVTPIFDRPPIIKTFKNINPDTCAEGMPAFVKQKNAWLKSLPADDVDSAYMGTYTYKNISKDVMEYSLDVAVYDIGSRTTEVQQWKHQFKVNNDGTCKALN